MKIYKNAVFVPCKNVRVGLPPECCGMCMFALILVDVCTLQRKKGWLKMLFAMTVHVIYPKNAQQCHTAKGLMHESYVYKPCNWQ